MAKNPSRVFFESFGSGIGSPSISCSCGRRHHAPGNPYIDEAEVAEMRADAENCPASVVLHEADDAVSARTIGGRTVVVECECNWMYHFEQLLWDERDRILRYFKNRRDGDARALAALDELSENGSAKISTKGE